MDLLATVRKEGARGGRGDFKWADVQSSTHRENYLGHSLMAPVGRWQKGRDLNWYAKGGGENGDGEDPAAKAERERREEIKNIKDAEQDALARALGFEVAPRNPNMEALGDRREVDKIIKEAAEEEEGREEGKGVGFGSYGGRIGPRQEDSEERLEGTTPVRSSAETLDRSMKGRRRDGSRGGGTSIVNMMADVAQGHERDHENVIRGLDRRVATGGEMTIMSLRREVNGEIEVVHLTVATVIEDPTISTTNPSEDERHTTPARRMLPA